MIPLFLRYRDIIPDFSPFCESLEQPFPQHLRVNTLKIEPRNLLTMFREKGIRLNPMGDRQGSIFEAAGLRSPGNLMEYFQGYIHPQALTSCLASLVLSPDPDSLVLDLCASPGGKTSHLAQLMNNRGLIVANELYPSRHIPLAHTLSRLGVVNTLFTSYQAQEFPLKQRFHYVLADVPCSGEGRIRVRKERQGESDDRESEFRPRLIEIQKKIIIRGYDLLEAGGEMLYSTCTYNPDENEAVVQFLLENRDASLLPVHRDFPYEPGLTRWKDESYEEQLERAARFYPHRVNSVGFFMARIVRRKG
jgi:NOL1/NOP2/sun family putative RNA methylase